MFYESSFTICGENLCYWSQLETEHVYIVKIQPLLLQLEKEPENEFKYEDLIELASKPKTGLDEDNAADTKLSAQHDSSRGEGED